MKRDPYSGVSNVRYLDELRSDMIEDFRNGKKHSLYTTGFPELDNHFKWMRKDLTLFGGIGNHGKSTFAYQLALSMSMRHDTKWAVFSPEQDPPDYFYNDLIHTMEGKSTDKNHVNQMDEAQYTKGLEFIDSHFYYVFPSSDSPTPDLILGTFERLIAADGVDGVIIDPFNQLDHDWEHSKRDDRYISDFLSRCKRFAQIHNLFFVIVAHPKGGIRKNDTGDYECPDVFDLAGGAMWNNKCDNIIFVHRPYKTTEPENNETLVRVAKIKKQKIIGVPGDVTFTFDRFQNRFKQQTITHELQTSIKPTTELPF